MQSDGNSFGGYVVLESINMPYRGEGNIFDQIYKKGNLFGFLLYIIIFIFYNIIRI